MQLVIELRPEDFYSIKALREDFIKIMFSGSSQQALLSIRKALVLPEHHGDLKDVNSVVKAIEDRVEFLRKNDAIFRRLRKDIDILGCIPKIRCEVPTIIPATKEGE